MKIKNIFIKNNLKVKESKKIHITKDEASEFYKVHQSKPFYNDLCAYLSSGPIVVMILEGDRRSNVKQKINGCDQSKRCRRKYYQKIIWYFYR